MKAVHKVKDKGTKQSLPKEINLPTTSVKNKKLRQFLSFVTLFDGSDRWPGMQLYTAYNGLMISTKNFRDLALMHAEEFPNDKSLIEHVAEGFECDLFDDPVFDHFWFLSLLAAYDCKESVKFASEYFSTYIGDIDENHLVELFRKWSCEEAGHCSIDLFDLDELSFDDCKNCVQRCRIAGHLDKSWMNRFKRICDFKNFELDEAWLKAYDLP